MINTCKYCKHWNTSSDREGYAKCENLTDKPEIDVSFTLYGIAAGFDDKIVLTYENFGCIHWCLNVDKLEDVHSLIPGKMVPRRYIGGPYDLMIRDVDRNITAEVKDGCLLYHLEDDGCFHFEKIIYYPPDESRFDPGYTHVDKFVYKKEGEYSRPD